MIKLLFPYEKKNLQMCFGRKWPIYSSSEDVSILWKVVINSPVFQCRQPPLGKISSSLVIHAKKNVGCYFVLGQLEGENSLKKVILFSYFQYPFLEPFTIFVKRLGHSPMWKWVVLWREIIVFTQFTNKR